MKKSYKIHFYVLKINKYKLLCIIKADLRPRDNFLSSTVDFTSLRKSTNLKVAARAKE